MRKSTYVKTSRKVIVEKTSTEELFKLTCKSQHSKKCKDGKRRSYWLFFLNGVLILKQKVPFDPEMERGFDVKTGRTNEYLFNNCIYQQRYTDYRQIADGTSRIVKYPVSKRKLEALNVPSDFKIVLTK